MAVPKRKVSKARRDKRRSSHWKLETPRYRDLPQVRCLSAASPDVQNCLDLQRPFLRPG